MEPAVLNQQSLSKDSKIMCDDTFEIEVVKYIAYIELQSHINYMTGYWYTDSICNGPLARYIKSRVAHAPGMPGTFPPPPKLKETAC